MSWFKDWFNTPYYHLLYKNRDFSEAEKFIDNIIEYLNPAEDSNFLDLACGKGRHSIYINKKGYDVTGVDLSEKSILFANQKRSDSLRFDTHDMRDIYCEDKFNYIFNLFTSFGYFEDDQEDIKVLEAVNKELKPNGVFVFDYLNTQFVIDQLIPQETIRRDNIDFEITKSVENSFVVKNIDFKDQGKVYHFQEKVKLLYLEKLKDYFKQANLEIENIFGDYDLNPFDQKKSNRLILVAKKIG